jgi:hypothetical protein
LPASGRLDDRGRLLRRNLIWALFLPLVFAANIVLATLAWIILGAVMRQRPAAFECAVMEERHAGRRQVNDPKAQELATAHEKLAVAIQKRLDEQVPPLAPQ